MARLMLTSGIPSSSFIACTPCLKVYMSSMVLAPSLNTLGSSFKTRTVTSPEFSKSFLLRTMATAFTEIELRRSPA